MSAVLTAGIATSSSGMFTSLRHDWATPRKLFLVLDSEFHFTLDACATKDTAVCDRFWASGGLSEVWDESTFCNPPYGRSIGRWVEKAYRESRLGSTVVMLLPARTDTQWFHDYCLKGEIRFLRGRLYFDDAKGKRAPFPSMIVVFRRAFEIEGRF